MPVATAHIAGACARTIVPQPRTTTIRTHHIDPPLGIARQHVGRRMAEPAAVTRLHHGQPGLHGIQEGAGAGASSGAPAAGSAVNPAGPFKGSKPPATK